MREVGRKVGGTMMLRWEYGEESGTMMLAEVGVWVGKWEGL